MSTSLAPLLEETGGYPFGGPNGHPLPGTGMPVRLPTGCAAPDSAAADPVGGRQSRPVDRRASLIKTLRHDAESLSSRDLLSLYLTYVAAEGSCEDRCARLLDRYASLGNILATSWRRLDEAPECAGGLADALKLLHAIVLAVLQEPLAGGSNLGSLAKLKDYLRVSLGHRRVEMVRVLFLDERHRLIKDELHSQGTAHSAPLEPYHVARRGLELGAKGVILVHNHPSGDPTPSPADKAVTLRMCDMLLQRCSIRLIDHVIVGRTKCVSLRQLNYF
jgi:DNA repair protein RadC